MIGADHVLTIAAADYFRKEGADFGQLGQHFYFFEEALRRLHVNERVNAGGDVFERINFQRDAHAALRAH